MSPWTRSLACVFAALLAVATVSAQAGAPPPPPPAGTSLVLGQVLDGLTNRPVADVAIVANGNGAQLNARPTATDADGHFVFRNLPAGLYTFEARKAGYVNGVNGATRPSGLGRPILLSDNDRIGDVSIRLWKFAAIGGTVVDDAGEPAVGLSVRALRRTLTAGHWRLQATGATQFSVTTDDRGLYRFFELAPGDWIVMIPSVTTVVPLSQSEAFDALRLDPARSRDEYLAASDTFSSIGAEIGSGRTLQVGNFMQSIYSQGLPPPSARGEVSYVYPTQFYPNAVAASLAQPVTLGSGEDRAGVDFAMKPVRTLRVSGTVADAAGPVTGIPVRLMPATGSDLLTEMDVATTLSDGQGRFTLFGVPAGQYMLRVLRVPRVTQTVTRIGAVTQMQSPSAPSADPTLWANVPVTVADADVTGVAMTLAVGARISGRVVFDGSTERPAGSIPPDVSIEAVDGRQVGARYGDDTMHVNGASFQSPGLPPGQYFIRMRYAPAGWTIKSAMLGGHDVSETPFTLEGSDVTDVVVTLTDRVSELSGTVHTSQNASAADAVVFLFPGDHAAWMNYGVTPGRLRSARVAKNGLYRIAPVPAGDYLVAALAEDTARDWRDPSVLDALSRVAVRVQIADGEKKSQDVSVARIAIEKLPASTWPTAHGPYVDDAETPQQPARDAAARVITGTGMLSGSVVTDEAAPKPLRRVIVTMTCTDPRVGRTAVTDDAGRFAFSALPAGRYVLTATKPAYLTTRYGATRPGREGTPIAVTDDTRATATLKMMRGAVITGVVRDQGGQPRPSVRVEALRYELSDGVRELSTAPGNAMPSDDHGVYRIYGLPPGDYIVAVAEPSIGYFRSLSQTTVADVQSALADLRASGSSAASTSPGSAAPPARSPEVGYAPVYYPGTVRAADAAAVTVAAGEERSGIDVQIQLVPYARVTAHVVGPDGQPPTTVQARLVTAVSVPLQLSLGGSFPVTVSGGTLSLSSVMPGSYTLAVGGTDVPLPPRASSGAMAFGSNASIGMPEWAMVPLEIDGHDLDLQVRLEQGKHMTGRVVFEGATAPPADFKGVSVGLTGPRLAGVTLSVAAKPANGSGQFALDGIVPNAYRVWAPTVKGWTIKSALIGGRDAADRPVDITGDVGDVVVTFTDKTTELSGTLQTPAGRPAPDYHVIVFPSDRTYWLPNSRRIASLRPSTDGRFVVGTLPPGEYLIAAVMDVENQEWFNPAFLDTLVASAVKVPLGEGEKKTRILRIAR